ncbi:MAG: hypothetical protein KGL39_49370 [Patescibacteria group bacterium]|nr:hypothetical protein [Patescibacteria group bacterium]
MNPIFEISRVRPALPLICEMANLPAFESLKDMAAYQKNVSGDHPTPVLRTWRCHFCGCFHFWSAGSWTDSNGAFKSAADKVPERIEKLVFNSMREATK